ncbi:hypothetical protein C8P67_10295 [Flavobacterium aquicola]|uniref:Lipocalin-like protein n=2 Tax=Flavobacterium aquicola TaxID=1682742 RepID=A0A3E0EUS0_9FLAO|nr:hypothetical protein C8P67_10295 [Flavobacterium aquicola]
MNMKYIIVFRKVLTIAFIMAVFISCSNDDNKTGANDVSDTVQDGTWKVTYFYESGEDITQEYAGYNFAFDDNTVVTAAKEADSYTGVWSVSKSTSDDDISSTIFILSFGTSSSLLHLSGSWKVIENTGTSLKLKNNSNSDLVNQLYFEKSN